MKFAFAVVAIIAKTRTRKKSQNISATHAANIPITCVAPSLMVYALAINVHWASRRWIVAFFEFVWLPILGSNVFLLNK